MASVTQLCFVSHSLFGLGCVFAERVADTAGTVLDVWFVADQKLRVILPEYVTEAAKPETLSRELRHAFAEYKREHKIRRARTAVDKPRVKRSQTDRVWRTGWEYEGHQEDLVPAE